VDGRVLGLPRNVPNALVGSGGLWHDFDSPWGGERGAVYRMRIIGRESGFGVPTRSGAIARTDEVLRRLPYGLRPRAGRRGVIVGVSWSPVGAPRMGEPTYGRTAARNAYTRSLGPGLTANFFTQAPSRAA